MAPESWFGLGLESCETIPEIEKNGERPVSGGFESTTIAQPPACVFSGGVWADVGMLFYGSLGRSSGVQGTQRFPADAGCVCSLALCALAHRAFSRSNRRARPAGTHSAMAGGLAILRLCRH